MDQNPPGFASEDEEATYCLSLLRDGDRNQKIVARERLSQIFEQRGLLDEAAQCLESNIREGIRDPRIYQRLAGVYRRQGRHELADEVLLEARRLADRLARGGPGGGRRGAPGRPARGGPTPVPGPQDTTRQMPAAAAAPGREAPRAPAPPGPPGELEIDRPGIGGPLPGAGEFGEAPRQPTAAQAPVGRPWWLSPIMVVLLILLCGPYGLALMWVRGNYPARARRTAILVWAGLVVLVLAAVSITAPQAGPQIVALLTAAGGSSVTPGVPGVPTPRVFPPASGIPPGTQIGSQPGGPSASPKPAFPAGPAPSPPAIAPPTGGLPGAPSGVTIAPAPTSAAGAGPAPSPAASAPKPTAPSAPAAKPSTGERVKVINTGDQGANMRERPGLTAPVVKTVPADAVLQVIGANQPMDGRDWRQVRDEGGAQGWIAAEFLEPVP
ncbi:MAG: SH3 domain-containing protein [Chloroflexota bacterium]